MTGTTGQFLESLQWQGDQMLLDGLVFKVAHGRSDDRSAGTNSFALWKSRGLISQFETVWASIASAPPENIFEVGIWDGGSVALWFERFHPKKHVAIDLSRRGDSEYFQRAWVYNREFHAWSNPLAAKPGLDRLLVELVEAAGSSSALIPRLCVIGGLVAVERGAIQLRDRPFGLHEHVSKRPARSFVLAKLNRTALNIKMRVPHIPRVIGEGWHK